MLSGPMQHSARRMRGFSLVEVMVAVLIIAVGLLGIAKMQALALSDTGNSRTRALVAMEAAGLASVMQADRGYWTSVPTASTSLTATVSGGAVTVASDPALTSPPGTKCTYGSGACTAAQMAAVNLGIWALALEGNGTPANPGVIPSGTANITCVLPATTLNVTCTVVITWTENLVNSNSAQNVNNATTIAALATPTYTIQVQP